MVKIGDLHKMSASDWNSGFEDGFEEGFRKGFNKGVHDLADKVKVRVSETVRDDYGDVTKKVCEIIDMEVERLDAN